MQTLDTRRGVRENQKEEKGQRREKKGTPKTKSPDLVGLPLGPALLPLG